MMDDPEVGERLGIVHIGWIGARAACWWRLGLSRRCWR